ncbi:CDP-glycerol glycerophosphotransferase family protein [Leucobacter sp. 7(1)]|uniref:CDP-glycerol glycerophosphotransferase family protein n=1 Tax=Leucobacter sp. 7(1) TaxID=1255613 RepID=UPI001595AAF5|nr:CDP-glycerol glycerophosphotransferase family protein [Leucobacter sp. 7(1)]
MSSTVQKNLARLRRRKEDWVAAGDLFLAAAEARGADALLWRDAARALQYAKDSRAVGAFERTTELVPQDFDSWYRLGWLREQAKNYATAMDAYDSALAAGGDVGHLSFRKARCAEKLGDVDAATTSFRAALISGFDRAKCLNELARLQKSAPLWLRLELCREGADVFSPESQWMKTYARLVSEMGTDEEANDVYRLVSSHRLLEEVEVVRWANALERTSRDGERRELLGDFMQSLPEADRLLGPGVLFQRAELWEAARAEYVRALGLGAENAELTYRIGLTYAREYRWAEASDYYSRAYGLLPGNAYWAYRCGLAFERQGKPEDAKWWYGEALQHDPEKSHYWHRLSMVLDNQKDQAASVGAAKRAAFGNVRPTPVVHDSVIGEIQATSETREHWAQQLGQWNKAAGLDSVSGMLAASRVRLSGGDAAGTRELLRRVLVHRMELSAEQRIVTAHLLEQIGESGEAVETLHDARVIRTPDGFSLSRYLPAGRSRANRVYAELVNIRSIDAQVVLFESNHGASIGCHPLAIFREMLSDPRFSNHVFVWVRKADTFVPRDLIDNPRVQFVQLGSDSYLYHLATAKYLINNVSFPPYFLRREGQRYLNTWHGTPMKTLGRSMRQGLVEYENLERNFLQASHLIAPNELTKWALLDEHHLDGLYPGSVAILGSPRLDRLVRDAGELRESIRLRLGVERTERLVLVAPTWRGGVSAHDLDETMLTVQLESLAALPGVRVVYRAHRLTEKLIRGLELPVSVVPADIDTNDLLAAVDHLVSDYSSVVFDFLVTGKPVTLFVPDLQEYEEARGLYLHPSELPFGIASTPAELAQLVAAAGSEHEEAYLAAAAKYGSREDGHASARAVDFLLDDTRKGSELNGRRTVLFHASMIPNGIASALLAILGELAERDLNIILIVEPSVLREAEDRRSVFERLPASVKLVSRLGDTVMTPEEFFVRREIEAGNCDPAEAMTEIYRNGWKREARRILGDMRIDVAIEWDGYAPLWAGILAHAGDSSTRRLIWQHNQMEEERVHKYPVLDNVFRMYPWFDQLVSVSEMLAEENSTYLAARGQLPEEGVAAVRNTLLFDEIRAKSLEAMTPEVQSVVSEASPLLVNIGRMSIEKNQIELIRALPEVLADFPNAKLIIAGSGPLRDQLTIEAMRLGVQNSVLFAGQLANPYPLMAAADLFVLPSLHEGQPVVLFEAMALGVGILASSCPGNVEALELGYGEHTAIDARSIAASVRRAAYAQNPRRSFDYTGYRSSALGAFSQVAFAVLPQAESTAVGAAPVGPDWGPAS